MRQFGARTRQPGRFVWSIRVARAEISAEISAENAEMGVIIFGTSKPKMRLTSYCIVIGQ